VNVRWEAVGFVKRADTDEANGVTTACVVAPYGDAAPGTARDLLPLAAVGRRIDSLDLTFEQLHAVGFNHRVQRE
jgi:hypothetical protein